MSARSDQFDRPGSSYALNVTPRASEQEDLSASKPRLEGFCRGSWWEVDIIQQRDKYFLAKYLSPLEAKEEDAWLHLNHLRLKNRKSDDWDCNILKRGMDVSVNCTHPDCEELELHSRAVYDAKITHITRATHSFECTCRFHVRFYCANTEDPIGCTRDRLLLTQSVATRDVNISTVSILQQPGIVPFYEILKSHLSKKWVQVSRWSNDAFFLRETKLNLHVPPNHGEDRLHDDDEVDNLEEALVGTGAIKVDKPEQFTCSSRGHHAGEQETVKVQAPKARSCTNPGQFPGSETKNCGEHFSATDREPSGGDFKFEPDSHAFRGRKYGGVRRKDPESLGTEAASVDRGIPQLVRCGVKRSSDHVPAGSRKRQQVSPEKTNKRSVSEQQDRELPGRNIGKRPDKSSITLDDGNSEDHIVDIGGGSSDEGHVYDQPPLKTAAAMNLQTSRRRSDEGIWKRGLPRLNRDDDSPERKPDSGFDKVTSHEDILGAGFANTEDDDEDCEVLEIDPIRNGSVTGRTKGLKARRKKVDTYTFARRVCIDPSQSEGRGTEGEPKKPLSRLRPRSSGKKQVPSKGSSIPHGPSKPNLGKGNGGVQKSSERPLYLDLFRSLEGNHDQEKETEKRMDSTVIIETQKKPKCGLNPDWDPKGFKYPIPTLEEKQGELYQQQNQQQQPKRLVADGLNDPEERALGEKVMIPDQEGEDSTCRHPVCYLKEDVGTVCSECALVVMNIEGMVPFLETRRARQCGEASEWDVGRRSPDAFQETTEYQNLQAEKEVTWMSPCNLPPRTLLAMHPHQKDGFAFLWRNLAYGEGSNPIMREDRNAGCILSHAPGTGKTFLVIAFLQSYMNQFPTCRPLIVAPKIMLRQWEKEFQRWKSDICVYILNTARDCGKRLLQIHEDAGVINSKSLHLSPRRLLDTFRLAMLYEWTKNRSVLLVSYNLFSCLTDESRDYSLSPEGKTVRDTLFEKPSLLVLDEGHFPRNKGTRIRRSLMTVRTNIRILLSGTLFQNNFEELFNTLYLVRPGFVEGFASFAPNSSDEDRLSNLKIFLEMEQVTKEAEKRARKLFVEEVGMKIEHGQSSKAHSDELDYGLERLGALTSDFVHHHTGEVLAALPGLRDFALILKPTQQQCSLLELLEKSFYKPSQYLEREIAVSQTSVHPVLVRGLEFTRFLDINSIFKHYRELKSGLGLPGAAPGSFKSFSSGLSKKEAMDPGDGVKTKFVFDLLCFSKPAKEKVLIFSQHITPLDLLTDMFIAQFNWRDNTEYLKLDGKLSLDERAKIIEKFNNPNSEACVLLASTKACGEGISLIGASRVVFLDVLWNPAVIKQAMSRAFRLGQRKIVYVYRLIASGTIEENKYKKAIRKDWLSRSIFTASQGETSRASDTADRDAGNVRNATAGGETGIFETAEEPPGRESVDVVDKKVGLNLHERSGKDVHRLKKIQGLLAWEVDVTTCKDAMLERVLENDKRSQRRTFLKVIEHGSDFREKTIPFGPDAREWFLEGLEENESLDMKEVNEVEADPAITDSDEEDI